MFSPKVFCSRFSSSMVTHSIPPSLSLGAFFRLIPCHQRVASFSPSLVPFFPSIFFFFCHLFCFLFSFLALLQQPWQQFLLVATFYNTSSSSDDVSPYQIHPIQNLVALLHSSSCSLSSSSSSITDSLPFDSGSHAFDYHMHCTRPFLKDNVPRPWIRTCIAIRSLRALSILQCSY